MRIVEEHPSEETIEHPFTKPAPASRRTRQGRPLLFLLPLLALLVVVSGDLALQASSHVTVHRQIRPLVINGPFIDTPLDGEQINKLRQLQTYMQYKQLARQYAARMTLDEKLGQLFMVQFSNGCFSGISNCPDAISYYSSDLEYMITKLHAGGVIMYAFQMQNFKQTKNDIEQMQKHASIPLIIATDEEGGFVERVQNIFGHHPGALEIYKTGNVSGATNLGNLIAHNLQSLGINTDLAPDVDVQLVDGPDQYLRTWGYTPQSVITYGGAYLRAVQGDGEIACLKHWPGLGAATTDAHFSLPVVKRTADQIYSVELATFQHFIQSKNPLENPGMIMSTDVLMPAIDPTYPGELSHTFMTDILRKQFGYDGVAITDALWMAGIAKKWNLEQAAVLALNAGNDMLLGAIGSYQMESMINALKAALANGTLSMDRVNEAVTRIITVKMQYHLIPMPIIFPHS